MFKHLYDEEYMEEAHKAFKNDTCTQDQKMHIYEEYDRKRKIIDKTLNDIGSILCRRKLRFNDIMTITVNVIKHYGDLYCDLILEKRKDGELFDNEIEFFERCRSDLNTILTIHINEIRFKTLEITEI